MRKSERKENNSLMTIIIILMLIIFIGTIYFIIASLNFSIILFLFLHFLS